MKLAILIAILIALTTPDIYAHMETPYNVAPRLLQNCDQSYIGYEYHEAIHPACKQLWDTWTRELILSDAEYFNSLSI